VDSILWIPGVANILWGIEGEVGEGGTRKGHGKAQRGEFFKNVTHGRRLRSGTHKGIQVQKTGGKREGTSKGGGLILRKQSTKREGIQETMTETGGMAGKKNLLHRGGKKPAQLLWKGSKRRENCARHQDKGRKGQRERGKGLGESRRNSSFSQSEEEGGGGQGQKVPQAWERGK